MIGYRSVLDNRNFARLLSVLSLAAACFIFAYPKPALAVNVEVCQYYAETATDEAGRNQSLSCHFTGSMWTSSAVEHAGWCSLAKLESVENGAVARLDGLDQCNHSDGMCEQYARNAMAASEFNNRLKCGLRGARYTSTFGAHKSWCVGARRESVENETRGRYNDLDHCTRSSR